MRSREVFHLFQKKFADAFTLVGKMIFDILILDFYESQGNYLRRQIARYRAIRPSGSLISPSAGSLRRCAPEVIWILKVRLFIVRRRWDHIAGSEHLNYRA